MPPRFGGGNKCKRCEKTVYQAEEKKDPKGGYWHNQCFTCKNCPKNNKSTRLDSTNINMHEGTSILKVETCSLVMELLDFKHSLVKRIA